MIKFTLYKPPASKKNTFDKIYPGQIYQPPHPAFNGDVPEEPIYYMKLAEAWTFTHINGPDKGRIFRIPGVDTTLALTLYTVHVNAVVENN